jgi:hypothetical protein
MTISVSAPRVNVASIDAFPLLDALRSRRSRRFAKGAALDGGPLTFRSSAAPESLTIEEEAALVFAAAGITGHTLAELPYSPGTDPQSGCGNIIVHFVGRTIPSGDALHSVILFVSNDEGTWMVRRPQDFAADDLAGLIQAGRDGRLVDAYDTMRVRVSSRRVDVPRSAPLVPSFNLWDANLPGTTYFMPVTEFTSLYINVLLTAFSDALGYYIVDDHAGYQPAGLKPFRRSRGGHLHDDPADGRMVTIGFVETALATLAAAEEGAMHQNLALMTEALGLGGFTQSCRHPDWLKAIGFAVQPLRFSRIARKGPATRALMRVMGMADPSIDIPIGLRSPGREDEWLVRGYCPPHYDTMRSAVMAYIDYKFRPARGTLRRSDAGLWQRGLALPQQIPEYSSRAIEATIAYCEYVFDRYGRFPATLAPFENMLAYQAHHVDASFYDSFYLGEALGPRQRAHRHG